MTWVMGLVEHCIIIDWELWYDTVHILIFFNLNPSIICRLSIAYHNDLIISIGYRYQISNCQFKYVIMNYWFKFIYLFIWPCSSELGSIYLMGIKWDNMGFFSNISNVINVYFYGPNLTLKICQLASVNQL